MKNKVGIINDIKVLFGKYTFIVRDIVILLKTDYDIDLNTINLFMVLINNRKYYFSITEINGCDKGYEYQLSPCGKHSERLHIVDNGDFSFKNIIGNDLYHINDERIKDRIIINNDY